MVKGRLYCLNKFRMGGGVVEQKRTPRPFCNNTNLGKKNLILNKNMV